MYKYKLYCISFTAMWLLLFIKTIKLPIYLGHDWCFAELDVIFSIANIVAYASMILLILSIYYIYQLYHMKLGAPCSLPIQIKKVEYKDYDYVNTLATIITLFSVLLINYETIRDLMILLTLLIVIYMCYASTNLYYCNPIFAFMKYRIAIVQTENKNQVLPNDSIVLTKEGIKEGDRIQPHYIADNVYIL